MCFVCMTEIIGNKPTKGRGSAQEPWEHRWGGVPPAESQGAFREEVACELVKGGREGSGRTPVRLFLTLRAPRVTPENCHLAQHTQHLTLLGAS